MIDQALQRGQSKTPEAAASAADELAGQRFDYVILDETENVSRDKLSHESTVPPSRYSLAILGELSRRATFRRGHVYAGTASPYKLAARRAKNKVAKQSRKRNRP